MVLPVCKTHHGKLSLIIEYQICVVRDFSEADSHVHLISAFRQVDEVDFLYPFHVGNANHLRPDLLSVSCDHQQGLFVRTRFDGFIVV